MTQLSLFPPPPPAPGQARIERRFTQWRDAVEYAQSLPVDLWDIRIYPPTPDYHVRAVRR